MQCSISSCLRYSECRVLSFCMSLHSHGMFEMITMHFNACMKTPLGITIWYVLILSEQQTKLCNLWGITRKYESY